MLKPDSASCRPKIRLLFIKKCVATAMIVVLRSQLLVHGMFIETRHDNELACFIQTLSMKHS